MWASSQSRSDRAIRGSSNAAPGAPARHRDAVAVQSRTSRLVMLKDVSLPKKAEALTRLSISMSFTRASRRRRTSSVPSSVVRPSSCCLLSLMSDRRIESEPDDDRLRFRVRVTGSSSGYRPQDIWTPTDLLSSWILRAQSWGISRPVSEFRSDLTERRCGEGRGASRRSTGSCATIGETG